MSLWSIGGTLGCKPFPVLVVKLVAKLRKGWMNRVADKRVIARRNVDVPVPQATVPTGLEARTWRQPRFERRFLGRQTRRRDRLDNGSARRLGQSQLLFDPVSDAHLDFLSLSDWASSSNALAMRCLMNSSTAFI